MPVDCSDLPPVRGPAESCCPTYGADACGANLFCAAFDGRTIPSCYVNGTQLPGAECRADAHCSTASCAVPIGAGVGHCRGILGSTCDETAGCTSSACYGGTCEATEGHPTSICDDDAECMSGMRCVEGRCGFPNGADCSRGEDMICGSRLCETHGTNFGNCEACTSDAQCEAVLGNDFEVCREGRCLHTCREESHCAGRVWFQPACGYVGSGCLEYTCEGATTSTDGVCR